MTASIQSIQAKHACVHTPLHVCSQLYILEDRVRVFGGEGGVIRFECRAAKILPPMRRKSQHVKRQNNCYIIVILSKLTKFDQYSLVLIPDEVVSI